MKRKNLFFSFSILIAVLISFALSSCAGKNYGNRFGDFWYTSTNGKVTITKYSGKEIHLIVPESIENMPVISIGHSAFEYCSSLQSVTIPSSVEKIGAFAFDECINLEKVTLEKGIKEIDTHVFYRCNKMKFNEYENGYYIGNDENPYMALVCMVNTEMEQVNIHSDTVIICGSAFDGCEEIREIKIPEGVLSIGSYAISYCPLLEKVYIPASVEYIDILPINMCHKLSEIIVAEENKKFKAIDGHLFSYDGLRLIKYAPAHEASAYRVPDGTVIIEDYAFDNTKNLTEIILPDSLEVIGDKAFLECENIKTITFGNNLKTIGSQAFGFCMSITEIILPDSVEIVSYSAFSYCEKLEKVVIGSGVVSIEEGAFDGCDALKEVVFKDTKNWSMIGMYDLFPKKIDVSNPVENAKNLTDEYCYLYWNKN